MLCPLSYGRSRLNQILTSGRSTSSLRVRSARIDLRLGRVNLRLGDGDVCIDLGRLRREHVVSFDHITDLHVNNTHRPLARCRLR
jgi:hypothetical protein